MNNDFLLIGVDGGASKVSAWEIIFDTSGTEFKLGKLSAQRSYKDIPGFIPDFKPVDVPSQLKEQNSGQILQTEDEKQQETVYVEACALVIEELVKKSHKQKVLVGLGMPGLKTADSPTNNPWKIKVGNRISLFSGFGRFKNLSATTNPTPSGTAKLAELKIFANFLSF